MSRRLVRIFSIYLATACATSFAIEIQKEGDRFHMISPSCSFVENDVNALNTWNKRLGGASSCLAEGIETDKGCFQDVSNCLPQALMNNYVTSEFKKNSFLRILPPLLDDMPEAASLLLNYPFCKPVDFDSDLMAGDIGISQLEKHGQKIEFEPFTYLNSKIAFLRSPSNNYSIGSAQDILEIGKRGTVHDECMTVGDEENPCQARIDYFRCDSLETLIEHEPDLVSQLTSEVFKIKQTQLCNDKFLQQSPLNCDLQLQLFGVTEALTTLSSESIISPGPVESKIQKQYQLALLQMQRRLLKGDQIPSNPIVLEFIKKMLPELPTPSIQLVKKPSKNKAQPSRSPASEKKTKKKKNTKRLRSA